MLLCSLAMHWAKQLGSDIHDYWDWAGSVDNQAIVWGLYGLK